MAFTFGDSYLKLPPITKETAVGIDGENPKRSSSAIVRDTHGLVRLPPIVRLDSLRSSPLSAQSYSMKSDTKRGERESEMTKFGTSLKSSAKMDFLRQGNSKQVRKYAEKCEDEMKLINEPAAKETNENERRFFDRENQSKGEEKAARFRSKEGSRMVQPDDEVALLSRDSLVNRRGSTTIRKAQKLSRSRRLAKSSPELCNRKISLDQRTGVLYASGNTITSRISPELFPESSSRASNARLSVHDFDGSVLSHLRNTAKSEEKPKLRNEKRCRSQKGDLIRQPLSTPNSPVCSESANNTEHKQKGRKSLNDITETVKQFIDRRRPSISPPKKQNLIDSAGGLKIEGKSCPQSQKEGLRQPSVSPVVELQPPQVKEKRHSLYDLQQILSLLQGEDLKSPAASNDSPGDSSNAASNWSESNKSSNASVYDLREFLRLAAAAEASNEKQLNETPKNTLRSGKMQGGSSTNLLSPNQERESRPEGARRGSVYDLMEFLSLGNNSYSGSTSTSQNSSRSTSPRGVGGTRERLSVGETGSSETRRSSTYDLMKFLSLPRSGASSRPESGQSSASSQSDSFTKSTNHRNEERESGRSSRENRSLSVYDLVEFLSMTSDVPPLVRVKPSAQGESTTTNTQGYELGETDKNSRENRSLSVYDLAEFLSITSGVPPLVRVSSSEETQTAVNEANSSESAEKSSRKDMYKKDSLYDLREILDVMEEEHETGRESTDNPTESMNAFDTKGEPSSSPKSCNSGYSSDSATEANSLQVRSNKNTRQMSVYDLRELLSLYAAQQGSQGQQIPAPWFARKISSASQSGISIHVTDESNKSLDLETDDVFLPVPGGEPNASEPRKRGSVYDLREFLSILNADDSPLRRRLSSVSSASSKCSETESDPCHSATKSDTNSTAFGTNNGAGAQSRPQLSPRQDSGGNVSLYDLGEFLSLLNTDEAPLRRRLSSAGDAGGSGEPRSPQNDLGSLKSPLYSLEEILTVLNDFEQRRISESTAGESGIGTGDEVSIPVPSLTARNEKTNTKPKKLLSSENSLTSVSET